jgi:arabinofuranan 3-O-arabinosyltransferase
MALYFRLRAVAIGWIVFAGAVYVTDLLQQTRDGLTNGALRPFGDDFINFWSAPYLAWHGRVAAVYAWNQFHTFQVGVVGAAINLYHYSYPPTLIVLTAPLALMPYVPALFVWLLSGWLAFYAALRVARPRPGTWWLALAAPAVFVNALGGQNGTWTAALLGGGLSLLGRRPVMAGVLFGLLTVKPQLGVLLPIALLAGRQYRTFMAAGVTAALLLLASMLAFGADLWRAYLHHASVLQHAILEDGSGVWHRMVSVFVFARRLGADVPAAYAVQAAAALVVGVVVAIAWYRAVPAAAKNALLVLGTCLATPYVQDYDLVVGVFVVVWLAELYPAAEQVKPVIIGGALILLAPLLSAALAQATGFDFGPLFIAPVFVIAARAAFANRVAAGHQGSLPSAAT